MNIAQITERLMKGASFAGHVFGMKELADQAYEAYEAYFAAGLPGTPKAPKGFGEELSFLALLSDVDRTDDGGSNGNKVLILTYMDYFFTPPPNTGRIGTWEYNSKLQLFMKFVLAIPVDPSDQKKMSPKAWLTDLAEDLRRGGDALRQDGYKRIRIEHAILRVPYPPEMNFDQKVSHMHNRMAEKRSGKGRLHRIIRDRL